MNRSARRRIHRALWLVPLVTLHLVLLFPGFFAPYDFAEQNRDFPFRPPARLRFVDANGAFHLRPFVYALKVDDVSSVVQEDTSRVFPLRFFINGSRYSVLGPWNARLHLFGVESPGRLWLFGTDDFGRDLFSRILFGGRISVFAGILGAAIALLAGASLGVIAGFYGRGADAAFMRLVELFLALPWLYLLLAVRAVLPLRVRTVDAFLLLVAVTGLIGWARPARLVRGIVLSARERGFVLAARSMCASDWYILRRHILPQTYATLLTTAVLLVPQFILAEVTLSFLGLGVSEPIPSWGNLLAQLQSYRVLTSYWWMYLPAATLVMLFLLYHCASSALEKRATRVSL
jgi:peptide/nickel transport system permease protein